MSKADFVQINWNHPTLMFVKRLDGKILGHLQRIDGELKLFLQNGGMTSITHCRDESHAKQVVADWCYANGKKFITDRLAIMK